jgi:hypothetical protein
MAHPFAPLVESTRSANSRIRLLVLWTSQEFDVQRPESARPSRRSRHTLGAAGAAELARHEDWVVMTDPEGNEFCVFPE